MGNSDHGSTYMRVGGDDGELRPWHYAYVYSIGSRLIIPNEAQHPATLPQVRILHMSWSNTSHGQIRPRYRGLITDTCGVGPFGVGPPIAFLV